MCLVPLSAFPGTLIFVMFRTYVSFRLFLGGADLFVFI